MSIKARSVRMIGLPLVLAVLAAGCGAEVAPPGPDFQALQKRFQEAEQCMQREDSQHAENCYGEAQRGAEALLARLVPGDKLRPQVEEIRGKCAAALAAIREARRRQAAMDAGASGAAPDDPERVAAPNLPPPVLAYSPPGAQPPKPPEGAEPTGTGAPSTTPPSPDQPKPPEGAKPPEQPKPPAQPKEPAKPQAVRVTSVEMVNGKTVVIRWTFTNLTGKPVLFGAPIGKLLNSAELPVTTVRHTYLANGFELNADDVLASKGRLANPESFGVNPGESHQLVTVGATTVGRQVAGAAIEVGMGDGTVLSGQCLQMTRKGPE